MRMLFGLLVCMLAFHVSFSQSEPELKENPSLHERFLYMKSKSQSYGAYKVRAKKAAMAEEAMAR